MASKYAKRAAMRARHDSFRPVRNIFTYAGQTLGAWNQQVDALTQASLPTDSLETEVRVDDVVTTEIVDLSGVSTTLVDDIVMDDLTDDTVSDVVIVDSGNVITNPVTATETVSQCHTHTISDWTGLGEQWLNGQTGPAIGTPDGHTHLVIGGVVQDVSPITFPDVPPHTHLSLTEI